MEEKELLDALSQLLLLREQILGALAEPRYERFTACPLRDHFRARHEQDPRRPAPMSHFQISQMLAGLGLTNWRCPFCGEEDSV